MSDPINALKATSIIMSKSQIDEKTKPTKSRFFQQKMDSQIIAKSNMNRKYKKHHTISAYYRDRMICSEDVSRKKKAEIEGSNKKIYFMADNAENDGDLLENLKKNFDRDILNQDHSANLYIKKSKSRPRSLFTDESLKLMNNFKQYIKEKDPQVLGENSNTESLISINTSTPFKDTSNSQSHQATIYRDNNNVRYNNGSSSSNFQMNLSDRDTIDHVKITGIPIDPGYYLNQLMNSQNQNLQPFEMYRKTIAEGSTDDNDTIRYPTPPLEYYSDVIEERSISQMQMILNPLDFERTIIDSMDDNDTKIRCPTPPLNYFSD
ncbi:hypothetical protein PV328_002091 [Microctonus aethiopoides]|uniref:Uncharacterized protein n=1 Tax=Microctonus aethiopoides TaxID=144406 RepID=A0AA39FZ01_9HYME|nr:hypothetical protein PV328_002091 [Microctonus aethiopoides]